MTKIKTLIRAPALTQSGYGVHSRQLIAALMNDPTIDLYLESIPWGNCAFLTDTTAPTQALKQLSARYEQAKHQKQDTNFDLFISVTIPQEFERKGTLNIGVTAAVETDRCSAEWLKKCNEMDLIIVPSRHAYNNIATTCMNWVKKETNESGQIRLEKPMAIAAEGFDKNIFRQRNDLKTRVKSLKFKSDFNFLVVGQWGSGGYGEDRKNIANTVLYFLKAFQGRKDVGLVLKVNLARYNETDRDLIQQRIDAIKNNFPEDQRPPIYLLHQKLSDEEMGELYNHPQIKCLLSLTHGEGFGLPLLEAAACALPVIATNWSGHLDFLKPDNNEKLFSAVAYDLRPIPDAAVWEPVLIKDSQWAVPREDDAIHRMRKMVDSYRKPKEWAEKLAGIVHKHFDLETTQRFFLGIIRKALSDTRGTSPTGTNDYANVITDTDAYNILYTMPMSTGDVFISTAVIDGVMKSVKKEHDKVHLYFATMPQYADILQANPNVHKVINWSEAMMNTHAMEESFDLVLTPNVATQFLFSNWVRGGHGRLLAEELANHCQVELGEYFIGEDDTIFTDVVLSQNGETDLRHVPYMTFAPSSGQGQWAARNYVEWKEVLINIKGFFPDLKIVQVGTEDEPKYEEADIDMRGNTSIYQLASLIKNASLHLSIDTFSMHLAASYHVPLVALFGSSHAKSTGPWYRNPDKEAYILLESEDKMGCRRACYKYQCKVNPSMPCINTIGSTDVVNSVIKILKWQNELTLKAS